MPPPCVAAADCHGNGRTADADRTDGCLCECSDGWSGAACDDRSALAVPVARSELAGDGCPEVMACGGVAMWPQLSSHEGHTMLQQSSTHLWGLDILDHRDKVSSRPTPLTRVCGCARGDPR